MSRKPRSNAARQRTIKTATDRFTWTEADAVRVTFPDGTVLIGDKVIVVGRDAIVEGDRFIGWTWAQKPA